MEPFETARLRVRPLVWEDLAALYDLYRQPELMRYITGRARTYAETADLLREHLAEHARYGFSLCAILLKDTGEMVGRGGLLPVAGADGVQGELAFLLRREQWGKGLATEFAQAMVSYGIDRLRLRRIFAAADVRNEASLRVLDKIGMRRVRVRDHEAEYEILAGSIEAGLRASSGG